MSVTVVSFEERRAHELDCDGDRAFPGDGYARDDESAPTPPRNSKAPASTARAMVLRTSRHVGWTGW